MRSRLGVLAAALVVPVLPLLVAAPAHAATNIICVNRPADEADCASRPATIPLAIAAAASDGADSVIRIGPKAGNYTDGPYVFDGTINGALTVQGSNNGTGANATILQGGAAAPYVTVTGATLRNVRITLSGSGGVGLAVSGGASDSVANVVVADTQQAPASNALGIRVQGAKVQDSTVNLFRGASNTGIRQVTGPTVMSRVTARTSGTGVAVDGGSLAIDNSVLDLDAAGQAGLRAGTDQSTGNVDVHAKHLTVVGGAPGARGVWAFADDAAVASTVTLDNSIVRGPTHSVAATATAGSANVDVSYSDTQTPEENGGTVNPLAGNFDVDPAFVDAAGHDFRIRAGSPVVDKASLLLTLGTDRDDLGRAFDGDGNGSQVPDMGAYELRDITAPKTTFTAGPQGQTNNRQPVFQWRSEEGATFECSLDGGGFQKCSSPATTPPLADGPHSLSVRATDEVLNVENPPATRSFTVDTVAPNATITKKPQKRFFKKRVKFKFAVSEPGATLQCNLDNRGWKKCQSTYRFNVKIGKHRLLVRATDAAGNVDPSPAHYTYRRVRRHR